MYGYETLFVQQTNTYTPDIPDMPVSGTVTLHVKMSCIGSPVREFLSSVIMD